ncbi:hypothetical protein JD844_020107 [Phrynosoma platyrhinos]|uniref:NACHT domain-containing protein n=1 Tax=Phrynosoma platyrhinos TaxID=52577 RepID=A0ABQ7TQV0_PHRPL|nr:hypothetical protein JD844_020107 [Phrynosoma platyrhinos]
MAEGEEEAYDKIAALAEYLLKDHQEKPVEEVFAPSAIPSLEYCLLNPKDIQVTLTFEPLIQQVDWPARPEDTCPGEEGKAEAGPGDKSPPVPSEQTQKRPESVDAFCMELKSLFQDGCQFGQTDGGPPLDHLYIEGTLAEFPSEAKGGRSADPRAPGDLEEKAKTPAERRRLFQTPGRKDPSTKIIVVLGKAGMGKSLLAQKICLEWSDGQWPEYDFVFRFDCWQLSSEKQQNLKCLLFEHSALSQEELNEVYGYVLHNPEKVLFIFDGFEELKDHDGFAKPCPCGTGAILAGLFQKKVLNGCTVLLTARPKAKLHQCLPKADKILELMGFSMQQAETFLTRYFEGLPTCNGAASLIQKSPYLSSHCHHPDLCRFICKSVFQTGGAELPSTLTGLFVKSLLQKMTIATKNKVLPKQHHLATLAQMAWDLLHNHQNVFTNSHFSSGEVKEFALDCGLAVPSPFPENSSNKTEEYGGRFVFPNSVVQNFLLALHLVLAKEIKDKKLTQHLRLLSKGKKSLSSSALDLVPRFLSGLLFLEDHLISPLLFGEEGELDLDLEKMMAKKKKSLSKYIRKLPVRDFSPGRLLQLFHCVHETEDTYLLQHSALELRSDLSFAGVPLTPSDVHVLSSILRRSAKEITLDFRGSSLDLEGLRQLVTMKNVHFSVFSRASLSHAIELWKHLWETKQGEQLRWATEKFISLPFQVQTMKDVEDLSALVRLEEEMAQRYVHPSVHPIYHRGFRFGAGEQKGRLADSNGCKIHRIPAIADLKQLEFTLDSPKENEIGDEGVLSFCKVLPRLHSLETLNLYNNSIGDNGAENFAKMLPKMPSLRVLELWNPTIPHGVLDHLQQLDSRIRLL